MGRGRDGLTRQQRRLRAAAEAAGLQETSKPKQSPEQEHPLGWSGDIAEAVTREMSGGAGLTPVRAKSRTEKLWWTERAFELGLFLQFAAAVAFLVGWLLVNLDMQTAAWFGIGVAGVGLACITVSLLATGNMFVRRKLLVLGMYMLAGSVLCGLIAALASGFAGLGGGVTVVMAVVGLVVLSRVPLDED